MSRRRFPVRGMLVTMLAVLPILNCECGRTELIDTPDAAVDEVIPDAGPPPAEYPLKPGDKLRYPPPLTVVFCNETIGPVGCTEQSTAWTAEFTIGAAGATWNGSTASWDVPAEYFWTVADSTRTDETSFQTLSQLWLSDFGPWDQPTMATDTSEGVYTTKNMLIEGGLPTTFPFFDLAHWPSASQAFEAYVKSKDPEAKVENQLAARKIEGGYLEPSDRSLLHFVSIIYHPLGFVCSYQEFIGPWDPTKQKNNAGFRNNERKWQAINNGVQLVRATGPKAGMRQFCKCGTQAAGSDCE